MSISAIPPPPPIHNDPRGQVVNYLGFPFRDDVAFYKANVDPSWVPQKGQEPNLGAALYYIKQATNYDRMTMATVWTDAQKPEVVFMLAVASAEKDTPGNRIARLTTEQLMYIAKKAHLDEVRPVWMRSCWDKRDLQGMGVPWPEL
ncbi:hypothetical protein FPV67DRAFT_1664261 [Lyophyllum atratum]|nr:hypothetical protein FPV67DRAFT_1664261 [Lyophyllum atratum]